MQITPHFCLQFRPLPSTLNSFPAASAGELTLTNADRGMLQERLDPACHTLWRQAAGGADEELWEHTSEGSDIMNNRTWDELSVNANAIRLPAVTKGGKVRKDWAFILINTTGIPPPPPPPPLCSRFACRGFCLLIKSAHFFLHESLAIFRSSRSAHLPSASQLLCSGLGLHQPSPTVPSVPVSEVAVLLFQVTGHSLEVSLPTLLSTLLSANPSGTFQGLLSHTYQP